MENHRRLKRLLKLLNEHKTVTTLQLAEWLCISKPTVRRELARLNELGLLARTRGGACLLDERMARSGLRVPKAIDPSADPRKRAIARYAASLCVTGDSIIVNGGTTTGMMAEFLSDLSLRVLTNSFSMAGRLLATGDHDVHLQGGTVYRAADVVLSPFENDVTQHFHATKMFMSAHGLSLMGLMEIDPLLVQAESNLLRQAEQLIVLADSSKFSRRAGMVLCGLQRISCLITDTDAPRELMRTLERAGIKVVMVPPDEDFVGLGDLTSASPAQFANH
jgi:DeoR family ulaG and ulaABCDEF operon transcriptional repressor